MPAKLIGEDGSANGGQRYEAWVPDTLHLQVRAALGVHLLTAPTGPDADYEVY